jgi:flagellum-specific peptidoglycan hydrolase FlgJ
MRKYILIPIILYLLFLLFWSEQKKNNWFEGSKELSNEELIQNYIDSFQLTASHEMLRSGVPASIKLAQGILESRYGQSELAVHANNHFGMKCGTEWQGNRYCKYSPEWSDGKVESQKLGCFRRYDNVAACYKAHSDFLRYRKYYKDLFLLSSYDYESWAKGLQKAGYATDPNYAEKLISLIERYQLYQYDIPNLEPEFPLIKKRVRFPEDSIKR